MAGLDPWPSALPMSCMMMANRLVSFLSLALVCKEPPTGVNNLVGFGSETPSCF